MNIEEFVKEIVETYSSVAVSALIPGFGVSRCDVQSTSIFLDNTALVIGNDDTGMIISHADSYEISKDEFEEDYVLYDKETGANIMFSVA